MAHGWTRACSERLANKSAGKCLALTSASAMDLTYNWPLTGGLPELGGGGGLFFSEQGRFLCLGSFVDYYFFCIAGGIQESLEKITWVRLISLLLLPFCWDYCFFGLLLCYGLWWMVFGYLCLYRTNGLISALAFWTQFTYLPSNVLFIVLWGWTMITWSLYVY